LTVIVVVFQLPGDMALTWMAYQDYNLNLLPRSSHMQEHWSRLWRKSKTHGWKLF